jgi:hypothetical protein
MTPTGLGLLTLRLFGKVFHRGNTALLTAHGSPDRPSQAVPGDFPAKQGLSKISVYQPGDFNSDCEPLYFVILSEAKNLSAGGVKYKPGTSKGLPRPASLHSRSSFLAQGQTPPVNRGSSQQVARPVAVVSRVGFQAAASLICPEKRLAFPVEKL